MSIPEKVRTSLAVIRAYSRNVRDAKNEPEAPYLPMMIQPDDICLHIGATDGRHSYMMAKALKSGHGHIYAFEPSPVTFPVLEKVIVLHKLRKKITAKRLAIGNVPQKLTLNVPIKHSGRQGHAYGFTSVWPQDMRLDINKLPLLYFDVESTTIDAIVQNLTKRVDFIRMDIEGSEMLALQGGWESIKTFKPHLLIEVHPDLLEKQFGSKSQEIYDMFKSLGYAIYHLEGDRLVPSSHLDIKPWKDYFFLHPERPHQLPL